jgi:glycosyltransferase involved in cell wall biosynthesis
MKSISIVFPAYNEEANLELVLKDALKVGKELGVPFEVIVVNDGSSDNTKEFVENLQKKNKNIVLINHEINKGYGQTLLDGFNASRNEWVFFSDSDRQFDLAEINKLKPYTKDADLIIGYRENRQDNGLRKFNAYLFKLTARMIFNLKFKDIDCAFKLMKKEVIKEIELSSSSALINTELLHKSQKKNYKIVEVPVTHYPRKAGKATGANPIVIGRAIKEGLYLRIKSR